MKQDNVIAFPEQSIDLDRVCLHRDEPCTILLLPVVRIEREPTASWMQRLLDTAAELSRDLPSRLT